MKWDEDKMTWCRLQLSALQLNNNNKQKLSLSSSCTGGRLWPRAETKNTSDDSCLSFQMKNDKNNYHVFNDGIGCKSIIYT